VSGRLLCRLRAGVTLSFELREGEAVLGREPGLAIALPAEGVSRRHARVTWDGKRHWVEDLRSTNGTFVNGHPVSREKLNHLDVVTLGKGVELVFLTSDAAAPPAPSLAILRAHLVEQGGDGTAHEIAVGEVTLGRSPSCNVVAEVSDVSKVHARVERTRDQLLLEDLGSANGTFVNDVRVQSAFLKTGDVLRLGGTESFRVEMEMGPAPARSGRHSETLAREARAERQRFSAEWKTRMLLTGEERDRVVAFRQRLREEDAARAASADGVTKKSPVVGRPAPSPLAKTVPPPVVSSPAPPAKPAPPAAPKAPDARKAPVATPPTPAQKAGPMKAAPAADATPPAPVARAIREIRLTSPTLSLVVSASGEHVLGRSPEAALRVDHPTVSRRHAAVILTDDRKSAYLRHEGGMNGTRLNGKLVDKLTLLADGDVVRVGEVELRAALVRG
jgi:pSer/pThr/pTyr-binding forkhead associated (FHA) protein